MPAGLTPRPGLARVFERLDRASLAGSEDDDTLSEEDVSLDTADRGTLALGVYSRLGLERALASYGSLRRLSARGLGPIEVQLHLEDPFHPRIVLWARRFQRAAVDLTVSLVTGARAGLPSALARSRILWVDGIVLQHPGRSFDWRRPPLPGQEFPGLAALGEIVELLVLMARRTQAEGLALSPMSFHAALIYARYFSFLDGRAEGELHALAQAASLKPLWLLAWAVELGCVHGPTGRVRFEPRPMLCPLSARLARVFEAVRYRHDVRRAAATAFRLDWDSLGARLPWERMPSAPPPARIRRLLASAPTAAVLR